MRNVWPFRRKAPDIHLHAMTLQPGETLVLQARQQLSAEEWSRIVEAVKAMQEMNPGFSVVLVPSSCWTPVVIGAPE
ncbi:hypothetical protein [uncultured Delftia sp.]|jgi:hypothetical protein|uniref:hypothetical protein n=1 Tax=uncultured Delftia sp. TaxID=191464 RepID=UPI002595B2E0|nr:hypothetical protein [uncultured Delftia sp.]